MTAWRTSTLAGIGQVVSIASSTGRALLLARLLRADELGHLFVLLSLANLAGTLGQSGFAVVGLRNVAQAETSEAMGARIRAILNLTTWTSLAVSLAAAVALWMTGYGLLEIAAFDGLMLSQLWLGLLSALTRGLHRVDLSLRHSSVITPTAQVVVLAVGLLTGHLGSVTGILISQAACAVPSLARLGQVVWRAAGARPTGTDTPTRAAALRSALWADSVPVMVNALIWRAFIDVPLWVAGLVRGAEGAALYGAAQRLSTLLQLPLAAASLVLGPGAATLFGQRDYQRLEPRLVRGAMWATAFAAAGLVAIAATGPTLIRVMFGDAYVGAVSVALILGAAQLINSAGGLAGMSLLLMNDAKRLASYSAASTLVQVVLAWPLAHAFGIQGLAVCWLIAVGIQNILAVSRVRALTGMRIWVSVFR